MNGKDTSGEVALRCYTGGAFSAEFRKFSNELVSDFLQRGLYG